jgi:hypothetical protein
MIATVAVTSSCPDSSESIRSLLSWLQEEESLVGRCELVGSAPRSGEMGGLVEAISIILGSGGLSIAVARSIVVWLTHRTSDIEITVSTEDGSTVTLSSKRVRDPEALVKEIDTLLNKTSPD